MIPDDPELDDLRRRFGRQREEEQRLAPGFRQTWAAARGRQRSPRRSRLVPAAVSAAGFVLVIALAAIGGRWLLVGPPRLPFASPPPASLADWRSPTGFLLATPADDFLHTTPSLGDPHLGIERTTP